MFVCVGQAGVIIMFFIIFLKNDNYKTNPTLCSINFIVGL